MPNLLHFSTPLTCQVKWVNYLFRSFRLTPLVFFILVSSATYSQVAPVNSPTNGFYINGKLKADSADAGDWVDGIGTGSFVLQQTAGVWGPVNSSTTKFIKDDYDNTADLIFSGSSFGDNPNTWKWTTGKATSKCDINTALFHSTTSATQKWLILGGDRFSTTGTSYIDFQFSQGVFTRLAGGTFSSVAADGTASLAATNGRTEGDFVLSMEYTNGGAIATVHYYRWELSGSSYKFVEKTIPIPGGVVSAFGKTNAVAADVPFGAFGSTSYIPFAFVEAAVNIDAILSGSCQSVNIKTIFVSTKASDSYSAALKDFVDPQPVNFVFGNAGLNYGATSFCKTGTVSPTVPNPAQGTFSSSAGLNFVSTSTGEINLATSTPGTYTVTYTPSGGVCLTPSNVIITINALPTAGISGTTAVCKDASSPNVTFTGAAGTAPYTFTYNINGGTNTTVTTTTGNSVTVAAPTGTAGTFAYNLVSVQDASSTTCSQTQTGTATITVHPTPTVADPADQSLCNGASTNAVNFSGAVSGTTFSWTNNNTSIGLAASGSGNIISFSAVNSGSTTQIATITVTPSANSCTGSSQSFTITVYPTPTVSDPADQLLCNGASTNTVNFSGAVSGSTFSWTNNNTSIGLAASGSGNIISFAAVNTGSTNQIATITVTPSANSCSGSSQSFTITVKPTPTVTDPADQSLCDGASTNAVNFSGAVSGSSFNWTNNNTTIGLAASGSGNIISFVAVNTGSTNQIATITVTPSANSCTGSSQAFTITVYPRPVITISATPVSIDLSPGTTSQLGIASISPGVTSDYNYSWSITAKPVVTANASLTGAATATPTLNILSPFIDGTYTVQVTATHKTTGCTNTAAKDIPVSTPGAPSCTVTGPTTICPGTTNTYKYDPDGNGTAEVIPNNFTAVWTIINNTNAAAFSGGAPGSVNSVNVVAGSNCNSSYTVKITLTHNITLITSVCEKVVTVIDNTPPSITFCPADIVIECSTDEDVPANTGGSATATDNCSSVTPTYVDVTVNRGCITFITRTWTATDGCGNSSTCVQHITKRDRTAPVITCNGNNPATAVDNCSSPGNITLFFSNGIWTAIDESGNVSTKSCEEPGLAIRTAPLIEEEKELAVTEEKTKNVTQPAKANLQGSTVRAYPNPFSDRVKFIVTSSVAGNGNLDVYNMMGQKIKTVYTGFIAAGSQTFELSLPTKQISNLVYVLRIGDKKMTGKLLQINQ